VAAIRKPAVVAPAAALVIVLGAGLSEGSDANQRPAPTLVRARYLMGTVFRFEAPVEGDGAGVGESLESALDEVQRLETLLSNWRDDSELSLLNARSGQGAVPVSPELFEVVESALRWARLTEGTFDPTVEPLTRRFRERTLPRSSGAIGSPIRGISSVVGWRRVSMDPVRRTIALPEGGGLDLGGIGKGYALDRAGRVLAVRGIHAALLDAGGQILAMGTPPGEFGWRVDVADPEDRNRPAYEFLLRDASAATSGNTVRPGEIINPATGAPLAETLTATAIAPDGTSADALSTALFVMGPERGEAWALHRDDLRVLYLKPAARPGKAPRFTGTLPQAPERHLLIITSRQATAHRSLHAEIR